MLDQQSTLDKHVATLAKELNLSSSPVAHKDSAFLIEIAPHIQISLKPTHPGFFMQANLSPFPTRQREPILLYLMKANFLGQGTGGRVIGLDPSEQFLILSHLISYDVDYLIFRELVEEFTNYLCYWQTEVARLQKIESGIF